MNKGEKIEGLIMFGEKIILLVIGIITIYFGISGIITKSHILGSAVSLILGVSIFIYIIFIRQIYTF